MKQPSSLGELSLEEFSLLSPEEKRSYLRTALQNFKNTPARAPFRPPANQAAGPAARE